MRTERWRPGSGPACVYMFLAVALTACGPAGSEADAARSGPGGEGPILTAHHVITLVQSFATMPNRTVPVQVPTEGREEGTPCRAAELERERSARPNDPERRTCEPLPGGGAYDETTTVTAAGCCRSAEVRLPDEAVWSAVYAATEGTWKVTATFDFEGVFQSVSWTVDDETWEVSRI